MGFIDWATTQSHTPTDTMATIRDIYNDRMDEFVPEYSFTEQDEVIRSFSLIGELLDLVFPDAEAALLMTALKRIVAHGRRGEWQWSDLDEETTDADWRRTWRQIDGWNDTCQPPFLDELHDLNAFANFGVLPIWGFAGNPRLADEVGANIASRLKAAESLPDYIESICAKIDKMEALLPRQEAGHALLGHTTSTRDQARARLALDQAQPITLHALALLSGVTPKRIQNAIYAKTDEAPLVGKNGLIAPEACEAWLNARDFHWSIWKQVSAMAPLAAEWGKDVPFEASDDSGQVEDFVFVPVANDGSYFHPGLLRGGDVRERDGTVGYSIGGKGDERVVRDFDEALADLSKMETPRWRRPNSESQNWGIVTGQTWKRVRRSELEGLSA